jgi:predicted Zn-dependent protease
MISLQANFFAAGNAHCGKKIVLNRIFQGAYLLEMVAKSEKAIPCITYNRVAHKRSFKSSLHENGHTLVLSHIAECLEIVSMSWQKIMTS